MTTSIPVWWFAFCLVVLGVGAWQSAPWQNRRRESHGHSRWARTQDLAELSRPGFGPVLGWRAALELRLSGRRWSIAERLLRTPAEDNLLAFGVQRSGKTSSLVVPTLLEWRGAAVATSTKDELVRLTGRRRSRAGEVLVFAPLDEELSSFDARHVRRVAWNPLNEVDGPGSAAELADHFTASGKESASSHWYLSAANLLTGLFLMERDGGGDLRSVLAKLNSTQVRGYLGMASKAKGAAGEILRGVGNTPEKEAGSIVSTARSCLSLWLDERVAAATSASRPFQLDLDRLLAEGQALYLVAPAEEAERCRPLFSALLASLLRKATARARSLGGVLEPRLLLALDEVANFCRIPRLDGYVSTGPGQGIQFLLCFHDLAQVEAGYGSERARTVWNNCRARLLLPGQGDLKTLEHFSKAIGDETVHFDSRHRNPAGDGSSEGRVGRPLCSVDELRRSQEAVLLYANAPPARLRLRRWDQVPQWRSAVTG